MAKWRKLLARMLRDTDPRGYTYQEAATVLGRLGFEQAPVGSGTSHRKWRYADSAGRLVVVGLIEAGHGTLKPYLIRQMVSQLKDAGLVAEDLSEEPPTDSSED